MFLLVQGFMFRNNLKNNLMNTFVKNISKGPYFQMLLDVV